MKTYYNGPKGMRYGGSTPETDDVWRYAQETQKENDGRHEHRNVNTHAYEQYREASDDGSR